MRKSFWLNLMLSAGFMLFVLPAEAHLVNTGAGPFYDGVAHFFLTFEELLPVLSVALFAGLRGQNYSRWVVIILPTAWILASLVGQMYPDSTPPALITAVLLLMTGALLALDWHLPLSVVAILVVIVGLFIGFLNGVSMSASKLGILGILGSVTAAFVIMALSSASAVSLRNGWTRIAIRVTGSWFAALGLLALGWSLRGS